MDKCEKCNKNKATGKKLALVMVTVAGWCMGTCAIALGVSAWYSNIAGVFTGVLSAFTIATGGYTIASYTENFSKEFAKVKP